MNNYLGILIEDQKENYDTYARFLKMKDIRLVPFFQLPEKIEDIYEIIIKNDVDFVIIDKELNSQPVNYDGLDVLRLIRTNDSEMYIIFLTSKDMGSDMNQLGEFDQTIRKKDFSVEFDMIIKRLNRGISRDLSKKMEIEIENSYKLRQKYYDEELTYIKELLKKGK